MKKSSKVTVEVDINQLRVIREALDSYSRLCCMQFDDFMLWERIEECQKNQYADIIDKDQFVDFKESIIERQNHFLGSTGASWNASDFVKSCYHIQKTIDKFIWDNNDTPNEWSVMADGPTLTNDLPKVDILWK